jgi:putative GTP pyrophosphokinase
MKDVGKATNWYQQNQSLYKALASKVADILKENIEEKKLQYHSITHRAKSLESFTAKAEREKYTDPVKQIKDMAGVRVITYLESDVSRISEIIEDLFTIDRPNSVDQSRLLGSDRVGYRSVHYVAEFDRNRCRLPEYKRYEDLPFEIQVRSLLQHAWAEIEHDRNYKFGGKLPNELERRFYLVAGSLEMLDREFVAIATEIDRYQAEVRQGLRKGDLNIEINTASLTEYLSTKFSNLMKGVPERERYGGDETMPKTIVEELKLFGASTLDQLDKMIPNGFEDACLAHKELRTFNGIVRDILIINDVNKYFGASWRESWTHMARSSLELLTEYGVDASNLTKRGIKVIDLG